MKEIRVNNSELQAFVDFGSDVTLIKESVVKELGLTHDNIPTLMKGFGNSVVQSLGNLNLDMIIDGVEARVTCKVVYDHLLEVPVLMGQTFTEQSHISVYKDKNRLQFFDIGKELPSSELADDGGALVKFYPARSVVVYGPASVKVKAHSVFSGDVLLRSSIAGKTNEQLVISGGLHRSINGEINIMVLPCSESCHISSEQVLCRAEIHS